MSSDQPPAAIPKPKYKLISNDNELIEISQEAIGQSKVLSSLSECYSDVENMEPISVDNVDGTTLLLVVQWCEHHKGEPEPVEDPSPRTEIPDWDRDFLNITSDALFHLVCASNYLDIKQLMHYCCKKIADMAKGKSSEELRLIYGIPTDEEDEEAEREAELAALYALDLGGDAGAPSTSGGSASGAPGGPSSSS